MLGKAHVVVVESQPRRARNDALVVKAVPNFGFRTWCTYTLGVCHGSARGSRWARRTGHAVPGPHRVIKVVTDSISSSRSVALERCRLRRIKPTKTSLPFSPQSIYVRVK